MGTRQSTAALQEQPSLYSESWDERGTGVFTEEPSTKLHENLKQSSLGIDVNVKQGGQIYFPKKNVVVWGSDTHFSDIKDTQKYINTQSNKGKVIPITKSHLFYK